MIYRFREGYFSNQKDAQRIGERLHELCAHNQGRVTPEIVVNDAEKNKTSVFRKYLEFNDRKAAREWRIHQARTIISAIVVENPVDRKKNMKEFVSIGVGKDKGYVPTMVAIQNEQMREEVLKTALRDMKTYETKYNWLEELAEIFQVARKVDKKLKKKLVKV